ncbi:MAG TPA: hypothetical protein VMM76_10065 [Pirellulaceae bacterium]|nr:hypothetical protein [Pirellulaceae bacterium]
MASLNVVAAPHPDKRIGQRLLEHLAVTVTRGATEYNVNNMVPVNSWKEGDWCHGTLPHGG